LASVPLACTLAGDWVVVCGWAFWPLVPLLVEAAFWPAELAAQLLATQTGAFDAAGVCALTPGLASVPLACTLAGDWVVVCGWPLWPLVPLLVEAAFWPAELAAQLLSTQTGAFAATGVCALTPGLASVPLACTPAGDWSAFCGALLA